MEFYVIKTEERGVIYEERKTPVRVEFDEHNAWEHFHVEVERCQREGDHTIYKFRQPLNWGCGHPTRSNFSTFRTVELCRVEVLSTYVTVVVANLQTLVKALLECGAHLPHDVGDCTVLETWGYVGPEPLTDHCSDCGGVVYLQVYVTRGRVGFCVDCDWEPEGGRHE